MGELGTIVLSEAPCSASGAT